MSRTSKAPALKSSIHGTRSKLHEDIHFTFTNRDETSLDLSSKPASVTAAQNKRIELATLLYEWSRFFDGVDLDIRRDPSPTEFPDFSSDDLPKDEDELP
jgi:hypothetical protein